MSIYLNNAATTWPKPPCVGESIAAFLLRSGANLGRGSSSQRDLETLNAVFDCRIKIAQLLGGYENADPRYVTFCSNITEALNIVLKGFLKPGMKVLSSMMEHNAVVRPLRSLEREQGIQLCFLPCSTEGLIDPAEFKKALSETAYDLVVLAHASNVCGTLQDIVSLAEICRQKNVPLVLDSAQTAGLIPLSASDLGIAALCFTGHKGLLGPQGIGGVIWDPHFAEKVSPLIEGGTGSYSHLEYQPSELPDKFEAGTPNLPGIVGLKAALEWLDEAGMENIERKEKALGERLMEGLMKIPSAKLYGKLTSEGRLGVYSVNFEGVDNGLLADQLSDSGYETRPGLHCSPLAHRTLGSFPQGSLRIAPGYFNTCGDIDAFLEALQHNLIL